MLVKELNDVFLLPGFKPKIPWNPVVMLVDLAVTPLPIVEFARRNSQPSDENIRRDTALERPVIDKINNCIPYIVGDPNVLQISPRLFLKTHVPPSVQTGRHSFWKAWPQGCSLFSEAPPFRTPFLYQRPWRRFQKRLSASEFTQEILHYLKRYSLKGNPIGRMYWARLS